MEGLLLTVNGTARHLKALSVYQTDDAKMAVWTAMVDGASGCGATLEAAILFAARAADEGKAVAMEAT